MKTIKLDYSCGHTADAHPESIGATEHNPTKTCHKCQTNRRQLLGLPVYMGWETVAEGIKKSGSEILKATKIYGAEGIANAVEVIAYSYRRADGTIGYALEGIHGYADDIQYYYTRSPRTNNILSVLRLLRYMGIYPSVLRRQLSAIRQSYTS